MSHSYAFLNSNVYMSNTTFEEEPIIIAGDEYFPPFEYVDTNGVYKGFNIDIMHAIAIEMGLDVEIHPMTWKNAKTALEAGEVDVIQGMTNTPERSKKILFSRPYLVSSQTIFIPKDNDYIKSLRDLNGKKIAVQAKDVANELVATIPGVEILKADTQLIALELLINGEADAYVGNRETGLYSIQKYKYYDMVKMIGSPINPKDYCIGVHQGNEELLSIMNQGLEIIMKNGTYDKIYNKWFGEEILSTKAALKKYIYAFLLAVFLLGGVVFINVRMNAHLRNEVDKRTRELKQSDLFKEHIINSISDGLITFDITGIVLSVNRNVSIVCQINAPSTIGLRLHETPFIEIVDKDLFYNALDTGEAYIRQEASVVIGNNKRIMEYSILPIKDSESKIQGITLTLNDVTMLHQNMEQIRRRDKFESIGRLTANIAHEIRNPLTAIKTYIELIPRKINNQAFQEQLVKDVPMVIERLNDMITELLEYARPREANKTPFALDRPIIEVMSLIEGEVNKNGIQIETELFKECYVKMDSQQFKQILINLLINAIEAVKDIEMPLITIKISKDESGFFVEITDNGIGISKEDMKIIFEPFFTKKVSGTGLGLSIAQQLAEENDGFLTAESTLGLGTTMRLYLPIYDEMRMETTNEKNINSR
jgi:polar amino acid transport system substrate-binding protein